MKPASRHEQRIIAALFLTPFLVLCSIFGVRAVISYFKTHDLIECIRVQNDELARQALAAGANPNARTVDGWTMVMWAVGNNGNTAIINALKDAGARTDANEDLFIAVLENNESAAINAIRQGANVNGVEKDGWTPLIWAACCTHPKIIKVLLNSGADVNWKDKDGESATDAACQDVFSVQPWGCGPDAPKGLPCQPPPVCQQVLRLLHIAAKKSKR